MVSNIKRSTQIFAIAPLLLLVISRVLLMLENSSSVYFLWAAYITNAIFIFHLIIENKKSDWLCSIVLGLILLGSIGSIFKIMHWPFGFMVLFGLPGTLIMAYMYLYNAFHLIIENKKNTWLYSIGLILILLVSIGSIFKTLHWPFAGLMLLCGLSGTLIMTCLFLYNSVKNTSKNVRYEQLLLSVCVFTQFVLAIYIVIFNGALSFIDVQYLYYPIAALCGTILLKNKYVNLGERNLILYLLVHSLFVIIKYTFKLFA